MNHGKSLGDVYADRENDKRHARFYVECDTCESITIRDMGPWDEYPTITNDPEWVVSQLASVVGDRRLFYYDSMGELDELVIRNGHFARFAPGPQRRLALPA